MLGDSVFVELTWLLKVTKVSHRVGQSIDYSTFRMVWGGCSDEIGFPYILYSAHDLVPCDHSLLLEAHE